jgi:hypothetical protein
VSEGEERCTGVVEEREGDAAVVLAVTKDGSVLMLVMVETCTEVMAVMRKRGRRVRKGNCEAGRDRCAFHRHRACVAVDSVESRM